jgi:hypothetical protein
VERAAKKRAFKQQLLDFLAIADPLHNTFDLPDDLVSTLMELEDSDESSMGDESAGSVSAAVKPRPHLNSGKAAVPEPE